MDGAPQQPQREPDGDAGQQPAGRGEQEVPDRFAEREVAARHRRDRDRPTPVRTAGDARPCLSQGRSAGPVQSDVLAVVRRRGRLVGVRDYVTPRRYGGWQGDPPLGDGPCRVE